MTSTPTTQVAIIGGGAMGASTAYYFAKAGIRSTIIESEGIGTQASGYNAGGLNPLTGYGLPGPLSAISDVSFNMHADLAQTETAGHLQALHDQYLGRKRGAVQALLKSVASASMKSTCDSSPRTCSSCRIGVFIIWRSFL